MERKRKGKASVLLHERCYLVGGKDWNTLEIKTTQWGGLGGRVEGVRVVSVAMGMR